jgi:hypothetical protein
MAVATSGLAATTTTTYLGDKVSVKAEIDAETGKEVTYLVKSGNEIVYIDQQTAKDSKAVFNYKVAKNKIVDLTTDVQFGTNGTAFTAEVLEGKELLFGAVNVEKDNGVAGVTFHTDAACETAAVANTLGTEDEVYAKVELVSGYVLKSVAIGKTAQDLSGKYLVKKGDTLTIVTELQVVEPTVTSDATVIDGTYVPEDDKDADYVKNPENYEIKNIAMKITGAPKTVGVVVGEGDDAVLYKAMPGKSGVYDPDTIYAVRIITKLGEIISDFDLVCE